MKYLYRSKSNKKIAGICAGVAEYFSLDPSLIRVVWLLSMFFGAGLLVYLIAWIIIPLNPQEVALQEFSPLKRSSKNKVIGGVCGGLGEYFQIDPVILRLVFLILIIGAGFGLLLYLILWICVPLEKN